MPTTQTKRLIVWFYFSFIFDTEYDRRFIEIIEFKWVWSFIIDFKKL